MYAVITIADMPAGSTAKIGFSVRYSKDATDDGITDAGYFVHQLTQTLQHVAVETDILKSPAKWADTDRLIDLGEVVKETGDSNER